MEKALFHEDSNRPPLFPLPHLLPASHSVGQAGRRAGRLGKEVMKEEIISSRHNIRYSTKISGEL